MPLVLDSLIDDIKPASERTDLLPVYAFNAEGLWLPGAQGNKKASPPSPRIRSTDVSVQTAVDRNLSVFGGRLCGEFCRQPRKLAGAVRQSVALARSGRRDFAGVVADVQHRRPGDGRAAGLVDLRQRLLREHPCGGPGKRRRDCRAQCYAGQPGRAAVVHRCDRAGAGGRRGDCQPWLAADSAGRGGEPSDVRVGQVVAERAGQPGLVAGVRRGQCGFGGDAVASSAQAAGLHAQRARQPSGGRARGVPDAVAGQGPGRAEPASGWQAHRRAAGGGGRAARASLREWVQNLEAALQSLEATGASDVSPVAHMGLAPYSPGDASLTLLALADQARLDLLMLREVLAHLGTHNERLALNLSAATLNDAAAMNEVFAALRQHPKLGPRLTLEIGEEQVPEQAVLEKLTRRLQEAGYSLALQRFGGRFSMIGNLAHLGLAYLKIDGGYIRAIDEESHKRLFIEAVQRAAHSIDLPLIAERVETEGERRVIVEMGIEGVQGRLFGDPAPWKRAAGFRAALVCGHHRTGHGPFRGRRYRGAAVYGVSAIPDGKHQGAPQAVLICRGCSNLRGCRFAPDRGAKPRLYLCRVLLESAGRCSNCGSELARDCGGSVHLSSAERSRSPASRLLRIMNSLVVQTLRCRAANAVPVGVSLLAIAVVQCIFHQLEGRVRQQAGSYGCGAGLFERTRTRTRACPESGRRVVAAWGGARGLDQTLFVVIDQVAQAAECFPGLGTVHQFCLCGGGEVGDVEDAFARQDLNQVIELAPDDHPAAVARSLRRKPLLPRELAFRRHRAERKTWLIPQGLTELATVKDGRQHSTTALATQLSVVIDFDGRVRTAHQRVDHGIAPGHAFHLDVHIGRGRRGSRSDVGRELPGGADLQDGVMAVVADLQVLAEGVGVFTLQQVTQVDAVASVLVEVLDHIKATAVGVAGFPGKRVRTGAAEEDVVAFAADDHVIATLTKQDVIAIAAQQGVVAVQRGGRLGSQVSHLIKVVGHERMQRLVIDGRHVDVQRIGSECLQRRRAALCVEGDQITEQDVIAVATVEGVAARRDGFLVAQYRFRQVVSVDVVQRMVVAVVAVQGGRLHARAQADRFDGGRLLQQQGVAGVRISDHLLAAVHLGRRQAVFKTALAVGMAGKRTDLLLGPVSRVGEDVAFGVNGFFAVDAEGVRLCPARQRHRHGDIGAIHVAQHRAGVLVNVRLAVGDEIGAVLTRRVAAVQAGEPVCRGLERHVDLAGVGRLGTVRQFLEDRLQLSLRRVEVFAHAARAVHDEGDVVALALHDGRTADVADDDVATQGAVHRRRTVVRITAEGVGVTGFHEDQAGQLGPGACGNRGVRCTCSEAVSGRRTSAVETGLEGRLARALTIGAQVQGANIHILRQAVRHDCAFAQRDHWLIGNRRNADRASCFNRAGQALIIDCLIGELGDARPICGRLEVHGRSVADGGDVAQAGQCDLARSIGVERAVCSHVDQVEVVDFAVYVGRAEVHGDWRVVFDAFGGGGIGHRYIVDRRDVDRRRGAGDVVGGAAVVDADVDDAVVFDRVVRRAVEGDRRNRRLVLRRSAPSERDDLAGHNVIGHDVGQGVLQA
nr:hypothetical protein [Tanacetum cinerariifolium]